MASFQLDQNQAEADGTATAPAIGAASAASTVVSAGTGVAPATGAALWGNPATAAGVGTAPAIAGPSGSIVTGVGLAAGIGTAPAISGPPPVSKKVVGWFDEWDLPPPPIKRANLEAIRRVQRNNGWLNAGRVFKSLNKSTKRMKRDQNFRYEDE